MRMHKRAADRTRLAIWLCVAMLAICLAALGSYLWPVLRTQETRGDAFGMVLIDIDDAETADSYHVEDYGVYVLAVQSRSPADQAGVSSGDLLVSVNDAPVQSTGAFVELQDAFDPGEPVRLMFERNAGGNAYAITLVWNEE